MSAETITTSSEGPEAGEVKIPVGDETIPVYRAMPAKGGAQLTEQQVKQVAAYVYSLSH